MTPPGRYTKPNLIRSANLPSMPGQIIKLPQKLDDPDEMEKWNRQMHDPLIPKVIDLFCGAGGMSEGFLKAGFTIAAALDHDKGACDTFKANIPAKVIYTDISKIEDPMTIIEDFPETSIEVIVGGPPCQGFSIGGQARIRSLNEKNQETLLARNELYQQYFRFIEKFRPRFFVMENVPAMLSFNNGAYIKAITQECDRLGYYPEYKVIDAASYGVPQVRKRLIIIGSREGQLFNWPRMRCKDDFVTLQDAIGDLPKVLPPSLEECLLYQPTNNLSSYQKIMRHYVQPDHKGYIYDHVVRPVREDDQKIFSDMKPGDRYTDIDEAYRRYNSKTFKDKYYMLKPDTPGVTITAHLAKDGYRYIHWDTQQHRTISIREAARIQSFGDHFRFSGPRSARFKQIGNAVPPLMAKALAKKIFLAIKKNNNDDLEEGNFEEDDFEGPVQLGLLNPNHWSHLSEVSK